MHENGHDWTDIDDRSSLICVLPSEIIDSYNSLHNAKLIAQSPVMFTFITDYISAMADNAVNMLEMDIILGIHNKVTERRLNEARECIICIAAIIERMEANILIAGVNLN